MWEEKTVFTRGYVGVKAKLKFVFFLAFFKLFLMGFSADRKSHNLLLG